MNVRPKHLVSSESPNSARPRLEHHPSGRRERPPHEFVMRYVREAHVPGPPPPLPHAVVTLYKGKRWLHPRSGQALIKYRTSVWNVARLLLEYGGALGRRFVNTCGYVECVEPTHWEPELPDPRVSVIHQVKDGWALFRGGKPVTRDTVVTARIPDDRALHVVRVLVQTGVEAHAFVTACGVAYDPGLLVVFAGRDASCEACLW